MFVVCDICDISINTAEEYDRHMQGKRHLGRLKYYHERKSQSSRSVFVKGFPPKTTEWELKVYFNNFGPVEKVVMDQKDKEKKLPQFAIVEFKYDQGAENSLAYYHPHVLNSCKLNVRKREFKELSEEPYFPWQKAKSKEQHAWNNPSGFQQPQPAYDPSWDTQAGGSGFYDPTGTPGFEPHWQMDGGYGHDMSKFDPNFDPNIYPDWQKQRGQNRGAQGQNQPNQPGVPGKGKKRKKKGKGTGGDETKADKEGGPRVKKEDHLDLPVSVEDFLNNMMAQAQRGITTEMSILADMIQVTSQELQSRYVICKTLEDVLSMFFPGVTISQFGSSVNGFGIKGCDMDVYVDLTNLGIPCHAQAIDLPYVRDIRFLKKMRGPLGHDDIIKLIAFDKARLISRILTDHAPSCVDPVVVPSNRCPIIRFTHQESGIKCDLSIDNKLALQNTRLLQTFSLYDQRVRPLVYAVRYWAKLKGIAGNPRAGPRLSNYALTLMVLYYLQNTMPKVLPTVKEMSDLCGTERTMISRWDCSFVAAQFIPPTMNAVTLDDLLAGFFAFFAEFDFLIHGICTRTSQSFVIAEAELKGMPLKIGAFNIQDPFVLDHNITLNINEKTRHLIMTEFRIAAAKVERWKMPDNQATKSLTDIFTEDVPEGLVISDLANVSTTGMKLGEYQFSIDLKMDNLDSGVLHQLRKTGNVQVAWCRQMCLFAHRVLERVLMFDVEINKSNLTAPLPKSRYYDHKKGTGKRPASSGSGESENKKSKTGETSTEDQPGTSEGAGVESGSGGKSGSGGESGSGVESGSGGKSGSGGESGSGVESRSGAGAEIEHMEDESSENASDENANVYVDMDIKIFCRIWAERKKFTAAFKERGYTDSVELEQAVSERLYYDHFGPARYPLVEYNTIVKSIITGSKATLLFEFQGDLKQKEFFCVYNYIKKFLTKLADKHFQ